MVEENSRHLKHALLQLVADLLETHSVLLVSNQTQQGLDLGLQTGPYYRRHSIARTQDL